MKTYGWLDTAVGRIVLRDDPEWAGRLQWAAADDRLQKTASRLVEPVSSGEAAGNPYADILRRLAGYLGGDWLVTWRPEPRPAAVAESAVIERWDESKHPRSKGGLFATVAGLFAGGEKDETPEPPTDPEEAGRQYKAMGVRAPAFKRWFGDWEAVASHASKVVNDRGEPQETHNIPGTGSVVTDADGAPLVVYHGTARGGFDQFDPKKKDAECLFGPGFYFTEDKAVADSYELKDAPHPFAIFKGLSSSERLDLVNAWLVHFRDVYGASETRVYGMAEDLKPFRDGGMFDRLEQVFNANLMDPFEPEIYANAGIEMPKVPKAETMAVYLNIRNPLDMDRKYTFGELPKNVQEELQRHRPRFTYDDRETLRGDAIWRRVGDDPRDCTETLQRLGYDGLTHIGGDRRGGGYHHRVWIAVEPEQVKSVDNQGTFAPKSPKLKEAWMTRNGAPRFVAEDWEEGEHPRGQPGNAGQFVQKNESGSSGASNGVFDWSPSSGSREVKIGGSTISYGVSRDGKTAELILIETPRKNRGHGEANKALSQFLKEADSNGVTVSAVVSPMDKQTDASRLMAWYKSSGFVPTGKQTAAGPRVERKPSQFIAKADQMDVAEPVAAPAAETPAPERHPPMRFKVRGGDEWEWTGEPPKRSRPGPMGTVDYPLRRVRDGAVATLNEYGRAGWAIRVEGDPGYRPVAKGEGRNPIRVKVEAEERKQAQGSVGTEAGREEGLKNLSERMEEALTRVVSGPPGQAGADDQKAEWAPESMRETVIERCEQSRQTVRRVFNEITARLGPKALEEIGKVVKVSVYMDANLMTPYIDSASKGLIYGCYMTSRKDRTGALHLTGLDLPDPRGTFAHELTHAIDGPDDTYSKSRKWKNAWLEEIGSSEEMRASHVKMPDGTLRRLMGKALSEVKVGDTLYLGNGRVGTLTSLEFKRGGRTAAYYDLSISVDGKDERHQWVKEATVYPTDSLEAPPSKLSDYAQTSASEGFAEFGRLVIQNPDNAKARFPKCYRAWKDWHLLGE